MLQTAIKMRIAKHPKCNSVIVIVCLCAAIVTPKMGCKVALRRSVATSNGHKMNCHELEAICKRTWMVLVRVANLPGFVAWGGGRREGMVPCKQQASVHIHGDCLCKWGCMLHMLSYHFHSPLPNSSRPSSGLRSGGWGPLLLVIRNCT